jgi:large subunit ribosomal protein L15
MVVNHRKKTSRHRGSWTHSHGEKKKRRGAGSRGGRGNAGSGKRGDAKKPSYWKIKNFVGKHGFTNATTKEVSSISISQLNNNIEKLVVSGNAIKNGESFKINLADIGVEKLLGTGSPKFAYEIIVAIATDGAIKKIESLKGSVSLIVKEKPVEKKKVTK